ncbi:MAG: hypothetical protein L0Y79_00610 [Chlorobi bacterium]|nr:hypothetical protein [Chlorobiota bacterium]MCI0716181.1 hypothetical protein [Chlorobiota bacterium]
MKRLILFELLVLFLATTFESDSPPGWFQQTIPVSGVINDIFFLDSLTGWVCTAGASSGSDTGYVMKTTNSGNNWIIQYNPIMTFTSIQFLDVNTGYTSGGSGLSRIFKTTDGGANWNDIGAVLGLGTLEGMFFCEHKYWVGL